MEGILKDIQVVVKRLMGTATDTKGRSLKMQSRK